MLSLSNNESTKKLNQSHVKVLKQVTLIWTEKKLIECLDSMIYQKREITLLNLSGEILPNIDASSFQMLEVSDLVGQNSMAFLQDYRDLIGDLSTQIHTTMWWATNISSKNRFSSRIPALLEQIEVCKKAMYQSAETLIIYKLEVPLTSSVQNLCKQGDVIFKCERGYVRHNLFKHRLFSALKHFKSFLRLILRIIMVRILYRPKVKLDTLDSVIVLKSIFYESSVEDKDGFSYRDPMFGSLPSFILRKHKLVILTDIPGHYRRCIREIKQIKGINIIPVEHWLSFKSVFFSFISLIFCRLDKKIHDNVNYRGINVSDIFRQEIYRKWNDIALEQFVYYPMMKACFKLGNIRHYIQTYENNVWEKMALMGIREVSSATQITGFQHAVIPQSNVSMFNSKQELENMPLPDRVVCVGKEPLDIINSYSCGQLNHSTIGCGLRYEYLQRLEAKSKKKIQRILVAPEGVLDVSPMLNYVANEMKNSPEYSVTFRFHPYLPYRTYKRKNRFNLDDFFNANLSFSTLEEDLLNHDLCIYWGSTVALEALSLGVPLVYYDMQTVLNPDPLFRCNYLKWTVTENDSLHDVICAIDSLSDKDYRRQADKGINYIKSYFYPVTDKNLSKLLYD